MSEDLKIQQGPSSTPYILGGGGLGAVAGLGATRYIDPVKNFVTEAPKYKSHEDLVNEAKDDFQKVIAEVESHEVDDKSFVDKLKAEKANIEKAKSEAEANWDKEFEKEITAEEYYDFLSEADLFGSASFVVWVGRCEWGRRCCDVGVAGGKKWCKTAFFSFQRK